MFKINYHSNKNIIVYIFRVATQSLNTSVFSEQLEAYFVHPRWVARDVSVFRLIKISVEIAHGNYQSPFSCVGASNIYKMVWVLLATRIAYAMVIQIGITTVCKKPNVIQVYRFGIFSHHYKQAWSIKYLSKCHGNNNYL